MEDRGLAVTGKLPGRHVQELVVVPQGLTLGSLRLRAEMATARLFAVQRIDAHELTQLHEVGHSAGLLEGLVKFTDRLAGNTNVLPVVSAQLADHTDGLLQAGLGTLHAAVLPHDLAQLLVERIHGAGAIDRHEGIDASLSGLESFLNGRRVLVQLGQVEAMRQVVIDRVGQDEVAV